MRFEALRSRLTIGCLGLTPVGAAAAVAPEDARGAPRRVREPAHDFPTRILYWLDAEGRLHARIEGPPGTETALEWTWRRAAP